MSSPEDFLLNLSCILYFQYRAPLKLVKQLFVQYCTEACECKVEGVESSRSANDTILSTHSQHFYKYMANCVLFDSF